MSGKGKSPKSPPSLEPSTALALKTPKDLAKIEDVHIEQAPPHLVKRVNALKNLQLKMTEVEAKFYDELHELECKYAKLYEPFYEKRRQIVIGEYEPNEEETKWTLDALNDDEKKSDVPEGDKAEPIDESKLSESGKALLKDLKEKFDPKNGNGTDEKGISNFWLDTLQSFRITAEIIQEQDEPALAYLQDIRCHLFDKKPYGYTLEFHFSENPYFTNKVLTKTYELKTEIDPKDPFSFEGPDLEKAIGCKIDWKAGKNLTVRQIKKKIKPRNKKGPPKIITKEEKQDSFFNFFDTPQKSADKKSAKSPASSGAEDKQVAVRRPNNKSQSEDDDFEDDDEDDEDLYLIADFEIGQYLREKIIPKAVLYYTGEYDGLDDDYDDEYEDDEDDEDDDDEDDDDENDDDDDDDDDEEEDHKGPNKPKKLLGKGAGGKGGKHSSKATGAGGEPTPSECKQN